MELLSLISFALFLLSSYVVWLIFHYKAPKSLNEYLLETKNENFTSLRLMKKKGDKKYTLISSQEQLKEFLAD